MKKIICFWVLLLSQVLPNLHATAIEPFLRDKETIVFFGDSITASGQYVNYVEAVLRTRFPDKKVTLINSGRGSETLSGLSEVDHPGRRPWAFNRFNEAVTVHRPTLVVACYGMNDGIYHPFSAERFAQYQDGVKQLRERVRQETGARLVFLTPPTFDRVSGMLPDDRPEESYGYKKPYAGYDGVLERYSQWLLGLKSDDLMVVDGHGVFREHLDTRRRTEPAFRLQGDGIHPNQTGHLLMALALLKAWGLTQPEVSSTPLSPQRRESHWVMDWKPRLPVPQDPKWEAASLALSGFASLWPNEKLQVQGMEPGRYEVRSDERVLGRFTDRELAAGVDLGEALGLQERSLEILRRIEQRRGSKSDRAKVEEELERLSAPVTERLQLRLLP